MNISNILSYIRYGVNEKQKRKQIIGQAIATSYLGLMAGAYGFFYNKITLIYSIVSYLCAISLFIISIVLTNNLNVKKIIRYNAFDSLLCTVMFVFESAIYLEVLNLTCSFLICLIPVFMVLLLLLHTKHNIKDGRYTKKGKLNFDIIFSSALIGAITGRIIISSIQIDMNWKNVFVILSMFLLFVSCVLSLGILNFLKLHYIKKIESKGYKI